jgi:transcriptional regulator with XRE-family HTH domain
MSTNKPRRGIGRGLSKPNTIGRGVQSFNAQYEDEGEIDFKCLGAHIREERLKLNYTQEELAERVGVTPAFIGHIERAERSLSLETLVRICVILGVSIDYLLSETTTSKDEDVICELRSLLKDKTLEQKMAIVDIVRTVIRHV